MSSIVPDPATSFYLAYVGEDESQKGNRWDLYFDKEDESWKVVQTCFTRGARPPTALPARRRTWRPAPPPGGPASSPEIRFS